MFSRFIQNVKLQISIGGHEMNKMVATLKCHYGSQNIYPRAAEDVVLTSFPVAYLFLRDPSQTCYNNSERKKSRQEFVFVHLDKRYRKTHTQATSGKKSNCILHYANTPMQYTAIFHAYKNVHFQMKKYNIFLIFAQNIDCGYTLQPPH